MAGPAGDAAVQRVVQVRCAAVRSAVGCRCMDAKTSQQVLGHVPRECTLASCSAANDLPLACLYLLLQRYAAETGGQPHLFQGSSSGAVAFGSLRIQRKSIAAAAADGSL